MLIQFHLRGDEVADYQKLLDAQDIPLSPSLYARHVLRLWLKKQQSTGRNAALGTGINEVVK
jgi:hypothetical protein